VGRGVVDFGGSGIEVVNWLFWVLGTGFFLWVVVLLIDLVPAKPRRQDIIPGELWLDRQGKLRSVFDEEIDGL
jgi:hypothetical protein